MNDSRIRRGCTATRAGRWVGEGHETRFPGVTTRTPPARMEPSHEREADEARVVEDPPPTRRPARAATRSTLWTCVHE